jgi:hypothetical protein
VCEIFVGFVLASCNPIAWGGHSAVCERVVHNTGGSFCVC